MRHFSIRGETQGYQPQPGEIPDMEGYDVRPALGTGFFPCGWRLYVLPEAVQAMCAHVEWGRDTARNRVEQGGLLFGQVHTHDNMTFGVVQAAIPGRTSHADSVSMRLDAESWRDMYNRAAREAPADSALIGWYHTHPGELTAFFSSTDRDTQATHFAAHWMFAAVLQPQRREWAVWHGADAEPCAGYWMMPKGDAEADRARLMGALDRAMDAGREGTPGAPGAPSGERALGRASTPNEGDRRRAGAPGDRGHGSLASERSGARETLPDAAIDIRVEFAPGAQSLTAAEWQYLGETAQALMRAPGDAPPKLLVSKRDGDPMRFHAYDRQRALVAYLVERNVAVQADVKDGEGT